MGERNRPHLVNLGQGVSYCVWACWITGDNFFLGFSIQVRSIRVTPSHKLSFFDNFFSLSCAAILFQPQGYPPGEPDFCSSSTVTCCSFIFVAVFSNLVITSAVSELRSLLHFIQMLPNDEKQSPTFKSSLSSMTDTLEAQ